MSDEPKFTVEEVADVPPPPRARVEDAVEAPAAVGEPAVPAASPSPQAPGERRRDYLEGFLAQGTGAPKQGEPGGDLYEAVIAALKEIYDPEIPVNIYDLGLVYGVDITEDGHAVVTMTLTTPHCPVAESMPGEVELRIGSIPGIGLAEVNLVWDPPWDPGLMSDEAKLELGML